MSTASAPASTCRFVSSPWGKKFNIFPPPISAVPVYACREWRGQSQDGKYQLCILSCIHMINPFHMSRLTELNHNLTYYNEFTENVNKLKWMRENLINTKTMSWNTWCCVTAGYFLQLIQLLRARTKLLYSLLILFQKGTCLSLEGKKGSRKCLSFMPFKISSFTPACSLRPDA